MLNRRFPTSGVGWCWLLAARRVQNPKQRRYEICLASLEINRRRTPKTEKQINNQHFSETRTASPPEWMRYRISSGVPSTCCFTASQGEEGGESYPHIPQLHKCLLHKFVRYVELNRHRCLRHRCLLTWALSERKKYE